MRLALPMAVFALLLVAPAASRAAAKDSLRQQVVAWMEENYRNGPDSEKFKWVVDQMGKNIKDGKDLAFRLENG